MHRPSTKHKLGGLQSADAHQISVPTELQRVYTLVTNSPHSLQPPSKDNLQRNPPPTPTPYSLCGGENRTSQTSQPSLNSPPQSKSHKLPPLPPASYNTQRDDTLPSVATSYEPCHRESQAQPSHQQQQSFREAEENTNGQYLIHNKSSHTTIDSDDCERITLPNLMSKFSFPLRVQVVKGFVGKRGEESAIACGEVYNIHFVKHTEVVTMIDYNGNTYNVPLNSAAKFGIIYRSRKNVSQLEPERFETAGDIMAASPLPRVVCAKSSYRGYDPPSSVEKNEVLVIQGIDRRKRGLNLLRVMCVTKQEERMLWKNCIGHFTTDPYCTQMYLPDILNNVSSPLPLMANMYMDIGSEHTFPECLISEAVILSEKATETSLVATLMNDDSDSDDAEVVPTTLIDLPTSLDIEVQIMSLGATEKDKPRDDMEDLYTRFNPSMLETCLDAASDETYAAQLYLLASIRNGHEMEGIHLEIPKHQQCAKSTDDARIDESEKDVQLEDPPPPLPTPSLTIVPGISSNSQESAVEGLVYKDPQDHSHNTLPQAEISTTQHNGSTNGAQSKVERRIPTYSLRYNSTGGTRNTAEMQRLYLLQRKMSTEGTLSNRLDCLQTSIRSLHNRMGAYMSCHRIPSKEPSGMTEISKIKYDLGCLVHTTQKLAQICRSLEAERREMKMQLALLISKQPRVRAPPPPPPQRGSITPNSGLTTRKSELAVRVSEIAARRSELASLNEKQIMELLNVLGMTKYQDTFAEQSIDGMILVECDESILQHDLGMNSKVDRIRLMKIISGQYSALSVLRREYPYVPV